MVPDAVAPGEVKKQIDAAVKKAVREALAKQGSNQGPSSQRSRSNNKSVNSRGNKGKGVPMVGGKPIQTGLKISFNPKELIKTTDRTTAAQVTLCNRSYRCRLVIYYVHDVID
jgi:hypothetical protein